MFYGHNRKWQDEDSGWVKKHSLSIVLWGLLIGQMVGYHFTMLPDWVSTQKAHGNSTDLWPSYWLHYWSEWFVSILADTYGALLLVILTKYFYEKGSAESEGGNGKKKERK